MSDHRILVDRLVQDLGRKGIEDQRVLEAMRQVPRHLFVSDLMLNQAYKDNALPIGANQTISQPYVVARMTELLELEPENSVLELGTGSGYQTAVLALLCRVVYSIERIASLAREALTRIQQLGLQNVKIQIFDGTVGWSDQAPFDRILVTAGAPQAPPRLLEQLSPGGRMVIPEGDRSSQKLVIYVKDRWGQARRSEGEAVTFVPLIGRDGWSEAS